MTIGVFHGSRIEKHPGSTLDYILTFPELVALADSITDVTWGVPTGLTAPLQSHTATTATVWLAGGVYDPTVLTEYIVLCTYTTAAGRIDARQFTVVMRPVSMF